MYHPIPEPVPLSEEDMINTVCNLAVRLEKLEKLVLTLLNNWDTSQEVIINEILKTKVDVYRYSKKTPYKRLAEIEEQFKGLVNWIHTREHEEVTENKANIYKGLSLS